LPTQSTEIALFPIPDVVAFPGTVVPLHVFEPRYRRLISECVDAQRLVGVCHTRKTIRQAKPAQSLEEALSSNQSTHQPHEVFSAGAVEVKETLPDGRMLVNIDMSGRFVIRTEVQALPYRIVECDPLDDVASGVSETDFELQRLINARLGYLVGGENPELAEQFAAPAWTTLTPAEFSFKLFAYLRFDPDLMQTVLESRSPTERLQMVWDILRRG
jgi:Lon protease-like protein